VWRSVVGVLHDAVGAGEHQCLVPVVEAHEIRRGAVRAADFDDLTLAFRHANRSTPYVEHVTDFGSHQITSTPQGRSARQVMISLTRERRDSPGAAPPNPIAVRLAGASTASQRYAPNQLSLTAASPSAVSTAAIGWKNSHS
jgi:hypothetical protein